MAVRLQILGGVEFASKGYLQELKPEDVGKFAAIDIETGLYETDRDDYTATERLLARNPEAQIWLGRVGQPATVRPRARPGLARDNRA